MTDHSTLFLRLEGPLQAWGNTSKFVIRRTMEAPTKSGVLGLACCAMGLSRQAARERLPELNGLAMGVRIDRPGMMWWDYHTVGAGIGLTTAGGGLKTGAQGTLITRREYLADASFLVALQGDETLIEEVAATFVKPKWPFYLGRKSCLPSRPVLLPKNELGSRGNHSNLMEALKSRPWRKRCKTDGLPEFLTCLLEWRASDDKPEAPDTAEVWYDVPVSFAPPVHHPRFVERVEINVRASNIEIGETPYVPATPRPPRPKADYDNSAWKSETLIDDPTGEPDATGAIMKVPKGMRPRRLQHDKGLCVFCKTPASSVQHITYRNAGGNERLDELRSLCRLCHDACTMLEYGANMGMDRINPEDSYWRVKIIEKRSEIIRFRSRQTRRRLLKVLPEEVE